MFNVFFPWNPHVHVCLSRSMSADNATSYKDRSAQSILSRLWSHSFPSSTPIRDMPYRVVRNWDGNYYEYGIIFTMDLNRGDHASLVHFTQARSENIYLERGALIILYVRCNTIKSVFWCGSKFTSTDYTWFTIFFFTKFGLDNIVLLV